MYVGDFITKIRQRTGKIRYSVDSSGNPTEGIPQTIVLDFINEAKDYIQAGIISAGSTLCDVFEDIDLVANTQAYQLTDNIHLGNKIRNAQYSVDGTERSFRDLPQLRDEERRSYTSSTPSGYIRRGRYIDMVPVPSRTGGVARFWFPRTWDDLSLRIGQITSSTTTSITLDNDSYLDNVSLANAPTQSICIVNADGSVEDYDVAVTSYDSGTRVLTIPSQTLNADAGDFVILGRYATSHTDHLPTPLIQQYVKIETQMRMFDQTSSIDAIRESKHLSNRYSAIIEGYEDEMLDETDIPMTDPFCMT